MSLIEFKDITKIYYIGGEKYEALKGINLNIEKGEFVSIMGPSGSGKSTMLHIMGCLDTPTSGTYNLSGFNIGKQSDNNLSNIRNKKIGFVFQSFNLLPRTTVFDNVMLPFLYSTDQTTKKEKEIAKLALESVGLGEKLDNRPNQLSGGQIQRVAIARSLVMEPDIILADEPTGNLDTKTGDEIMNIFSKINESGKTVILITHEDEIADYTKRKIRLKDGLIESDTKFKSN